MRKPAQDDDIERSSFHSSQSQTSKMHTFTALNIVVFCIALLLGTAAAQNKFNAFKSYRNEKVKPPHYGAKLKNNHPIDEYLNGDQVRMMKHRKSQSHHPDAVYKETWSGFDKPSRKLNAQIVEEKSETSVKLTTSDYLKLLCLVSIVGSVAWVCYMLVHRQHSVRKSASNTKVMSANSGDIEMATA